MSDASTTSWPQGFRILDRGVGPSQEWLGRLRDTPTSWISDAMGRSVGTYGLNAYHTDINRIVVGTAFTVRVRPGDNLMLHKAIELAEEGDVIVCDGAGDLGQSLIGGNMMTTAVLKKLAAFVIDGAVRDLSDWASNLMPVWARGHTHRGPTKDGPGEINIPIAVGGMPVSPGDLIVADADGVIAVPVDRLEPLWPEIEAQREKEFKTRKANSERLPDPERFNSILRAKGCPV